MKLDFAIIFYALSLLLSIGSLITGSLAMLGIALLLVTISLLIEKKS